MSSPPGTLTQAELQFHLDSLPAGATWELSSAEYAGPIIISKPLVVEGHDATIWASSGPVISVRSEGVVLRDVRIEVTGNHSLDSSELRCALKVEAGLHINLEGIEVRGEVIGLPGEEGEWAYPSALRLGALAGGSGRDCIARFRVPAPCRLSTDVPGLHIITPDLAPGLNDVHLRIENPPREIWNNGQITLFTALLRRRISVTIHALPSLRSSAWGRDPRTVVWEPLGSNSETPSMADVHAQGPGRERQFLTPTSSMYGLIVLASLAVGGQLWGLRSLIQFSGERERWSNAKARDEAHSAERVRLIAESDVALEKSRIAAKQAQAESEAVKQELARQTTALAGINKQVELARVARTELDEQIGDAQRRLRQEVESRQAAETKVAELATQRDTLAREVEKLATQRNKDEASGKVVDAELQKSQVELNSVKEHAAEFETRLGASQTKLGEMRQAIVKLSAELEGILSDKAKAAAEREAAEVEVASMKKQAQQAKVDQQAVLEEVAELRDTIRELAEQTKAARAAKEVAVDESDRVSAELGRLQKSVGDKDTELKAIQDRVLESDKRRTATLAEIEQLRKTLDMLQVQVTEAGAELGAKRLELQGLEKPPGAPLTPGASTANAATGTAAPPQPRVAPGPGSTQPAARNATVAPSPATIPRASGTVDPRRTSPRP